MQSCTPTSLVVYTHSTQTSLLSRIHTTSTLPYLDTILHSHTTCRRPPMAQTLSFKYRCIFFHLHFLLHFLFHFLFYYFIDLHLMKIAPLGLAGGQSYDRTNSLRTPTMKESQLLREKTTSSVFLSTCSNAVHAQFHWLAYTRNTRPCDVFCLQSKHFRSIAGMIAPPAKIYARDRSRSRWNMKHFRQTANRTRLLAAPVLPVDLLACTRRRHCSLTRDSHQPVMTGHNARRPRTGRERRPWWPPSEASYLTVWTLNDRFFASRVHCILRRVLSEYWRKETEKWKVFCGW